MDPLHNDSLALLPLSDAGVLDPAPATALPAHALGPDSDSLISQSPTETLDAATFDPSLVSPSDLRQKFAKYFFDVDSVQHFDVDVGAGTGHDFGFLSDTAAGGWDMHTSESSTAIIDDFFAKNGAYLPPAPCRQCQRQRLQCLILQTTEANPNPITSCSSCAALFRDCSLAERGKRQASSFETSQPVIGHLHGVSEEYIPDAVEQEPPRCDQPPPTAVSSRRAGGRSSKKTRALSVWFTGHLDHPYPSESEKAVLAKESGLSRTQVVNWFANARRRHRLSAQSLFNSTNVFRQGSHRPRSLLQSISPRMSPMECWRESPLGDETASASAMEFILLKGSSQGGSDYFGSFGSGRDGSISSAASGDSGILHGIAGKRASPHSIISGSVQSYQSGDVPSFFSFSTNNSIDEDSMGNKSPAIANTGKNQLFQCTFCLQSFRKRYDWVRHERSIHLPSLDLWICRVPLPPDQSFLVWRVNQTKPECIFCGESSPTHEHIQSHEFKSCAERPSSERTFTRKDHLWQHLHKFHHCNKWEGWKPDLSLLQHKQDKLQSQCGFCSVTMNSWEERAQHLASHFRRGATMAEWNGDAGIQVPSEGRANVET